MQIGAPMAMLIKDEKLSDEFISTMETRTEDARQDRRCYSPPIQAKLE
jgi:hypothetical protein